MSTVVASQGTRGPVFFVGYMNTAGSMAVVSSRRSAVVARAIAALFASLVCGAGVCYGWHHDAHWKISKAALHALPEWQHAHWRDLEDGFRFAQYCCYPDMGLADADAKPYLVVINKRLLHYFPRDNNREDFLFFREGAERYVRLIVGKMREGEYGEAAKFAGAFAHVLEDLGQPQCHALEGINGFSWTVLDELFTPEDQSWNRAPQSIIDLDEDSRFVVRLGDYRPQLLGMHAEEVAFRLYQRCCRLRQTARKALPAMLTRVYAGDVGGAVAATVSPAVEDAKLVADMFFTCFALAAGQFDPADAAVLEKLDLTALVPLAAPSLINFPYRFSPLAYGCSVNMNREPVPLRLWFQEGDGPRREVVLAKGIGTGCCRFSYEIPKDVFREFRCTAGLHSQLGLHPSGANLRLTIRFGGQAVFDSGVLAAGSPAQKVAFPVAAGGTLEFISEGRPGPAGNEANHAVWGEPVLIRLDRREDPPAPAKTPPAETR
jgi:hypothetical protein